MQLGNFRKFVKYVKDNTTVNDVFYRAIVEKHKLDGQQPPTVTNETELWIYLALWCIGRFPDPILWKEDVESMLHVFGSVPPTNDVLRCKNILVHVLSIVCDMKAEYFRLMEEED